jgi:homeodomain interacting protein kinase
MKQEPTEFQSSTSTSAAMMNYEYLPYDHQKRSSWASATAMGQPPTAHQSHHNIHNKRDSSGSNSISQLQTQQQQPPVAHGKSEVPLASSSTTSLNSTPIYHHHHNHHHSSHHHRTQPQNNTTPLGNSPIASNAALLQPQQPDIYAQAEIYRRPTVFVSQASAYAYNARVVQPPPAHNPNRQVCKFSL